MFDGSMTIYNDTGILQYNSNAIYIHDLFHQSHTIGQIRLTDAN